MDLLNPHHGSSDPLIARTIEWFEARGKTELKRVHHEREWHHDFLAFLHENQVFASLLIPGIEGGIWDTARICAYGEVLAFYGLDYWYAWQVTILGLGPIWQSSNTDARAEAVQILRDGGVFAFGLSEKEHGADIYSTDMVVTDGLATGGKYYIGNGNVAGMVSVFGRRAGFDGPDGYVFFAADSQAEGYTLIKNVVASQKYVSEFRLDDYPVDVVLHEGGAAFDAALNTVNVGKFNLGFASIGICEHAFFEAITHASNRVLYGKHVTDFPHVRQGLTDAYARLAAMKLFGSRAIDYFRAAAADDRRYLLFNPITKMKVTTEGERVIDGLWDVIAAKGFEKDTYFEQASMDIRALPKLEGTVHVNMALVLKFLPQYFAASGAPVVTSKPAGDDPFLWEQGPARGLGAITFGDWAASFAPFAHVPNVALFLSLAHGLTRFPTGPAEQAKDLDLMLTLGEMFTLVVYGQLILEASADESPDLIDQVFDVLVRDFASYAVALHGKTSSTTEQQEWALAHVRKPVASAERYDRVWAMVHGFSGAYEMKP